MKKLFVTLSLLLTISFTSYGGACLNQTDPKVLKEIIIKTVESCDDFEVKEIVIDETGEKCTMTVTVAVSAGVVSLSVSASITADTCEEATARAAKEAKKAAETVKEIFLGN